MPEREPKPNFNCPLCDADIPVDYEVKLGQIYYCSYCQVGLKIIKGKGGNLLLEFEDEE
jgi:hypothetical protein